MTLNRSMWGSYAGVMDCASWPRPAAHREVAPIRRTSQRQPRLVSWPGR